MLHSEWRGVVAIRQLITVDGCSVNQWQQKERGLGYPTPQRGQTLAVWLFGAPQAQAQAMDHVMRVCVCYVWVCFKVSVCVRVVES